MFMAHMAWAGTTPGRYVELPSIFSDNMVLQRNSHVDFWGWALPGQMVTVRGSWGEGGTTKAGRDSLWKLQVKTHEAGGPYSVQVVVGDSVTRFKNVMLGEVWICSGQSNMELPLEGSLVSPVANALEEIAAANCPEIRLFTVGRSVAAQPQSRCSGAWSACTPSTAARFSAVGYFFGRKLFDELRVPVGLIASSWGGTYIHSWISGSYLSRLPRYRSSVAWIQGLQDSIDRVNWWIRSHPAKEDPGREEPGLREGLNFEDATCSAKDCDDRSWKSMRFPAYWWETPLRDFNGAVWFRKTVDIPPGWIGSDLTLHLGRIVQWDETWVNAVKVGSMHGSGYGSDAREYEIPGSIVSDSVVSIALRVVDTEAGGETWDGWSQLNLNLKNNPSEKVTLEGDWNYLPVAEYSEGKFYVYGAAGDRYYSKPSLPGNLGPNAPTVLFNGMIAPVIPYGIKGVIWYQGESDADVPGNYANYADHFSLLIKSWRDLWGRGDFPFYWVQIAPYNYWQGWKAYVVRDAQRRTLALPKTGMAVTLDIGSDGAIHPPNKTDVGVRMALWALAKDYGRNVTCSGPLYRSMTVSGGRAIIEFEYTDGGLTLRPVNGGTNFEIAGDDSVFSAAMVEVVGRTIIVSSPAVKNPVAVRYAWGNADEATLFNSAGLPASTFRTDNWSP